MLPSLVADVAAHFDRQLISTAIYIHNPVNIIPDGANNEDILIQKVEWDGEEYRLQHDFNVFKHKFNKTYASPQEEAFRFSVFKANMRQAMQRNKNLDGFTKYSDMTATEFKKYLGLRT
uniref:cysteine proteinase 15A-like n=1 Tax=Erigeron canadensis TaxID=72917 RepID=UPI001CB8F6D2|nr:cysteine proteinase 15A-like [Erigeron canadensis]